MNLAFELNSLRKRKIDEKGLYKSITNLKLGQFFYSYLK